MSNSQADIQQFSKNEIFELLQNERRRHLMQILRKRGSENIHSITDEIIRLEGRDESDRKSVLNSLLQNHIPMMMNLNIISYEKETETVKLLPLAKEFNVYIETTKKGDISWNQFLFGFSTLALFISILIYTGLLKWVTSSQWLIFLLAIFFIASIAYHRHVTKL